MKNLMIGLVFILSINICAQNEFENTNIFLRVYDLQGKKISKGKILSISETSLKLIRKGESVEIPVNRIGLIKTKRSAGHNILVGTATGVTSMTIIAAATNGQGDIVSFTSDHWVAEGALLGGTLGVVAGGISILFKNSKYYEINGDKTKLKAFKEAIIK